MIVENAINKHFSTIPLPQQHQPLPTPFIPNHDPNTTHTASMSSHTAADLLKEVYILDSTIRVALAQEGKMAGIMEQLGKRLVSNLHRIPDQSSLTSTFFFFFKSHLFLAQTTNPNDAAVQAVFKTPVFLWNFLRLWGAPGTMHSEGEVTNMRAKMVKWDKKQGREAGQPLIPPTASAAPALQPSASRSSQAPASRRPASPAPALPAPASRPNVQLSAGPRASGSNARPVTHHARSPAPPTPKPAKEAKPHSLPVPNTRFAEIPVAKPHPTLGMVPR